MKHLGILLLLLQAISLYTQRTVSPDLHNLLIGKKDFYEIKDIVMLYHNDNIKVESDSSKIKSIKKQLKHWNRSFWWNEHFLNSNDEVVDYKQKLVQSSDLKSRESKNTNNRYQPTNWVYDGAQFNVFDATMGEGMGRFDCIAFHPTNTNIIFAGSPSGGLYKTTNGGNTWNEVTSYLPSLGVAAICIHPTNPNIIYVLSGDANGSDIYNNISDGVYKSTNGGATWFATANFGLTESYVPREMIIDNDNPNTLYVATSIGLLKTQNGGNSWSYIYEDILADNKNVWEVRLKPGNPNIVYITGPNYFMKSLDGGDTWEQRREILGATRISMAVTPANSSRIMLLCGKSNTPGDDDFYGVYRSSNSGDSFTKIYGDDTDDLSLFNNYIDLNVTAGQVNYNSTIVISPTNANVVLVGGLCVWSSDDGGFTWTQETAYWAPSELGGSEYIHPDQHELKYNTDDKLYVANDGGIYVSSDDGFSWDFKEEGLTTAMFYHFQVANDEGDTWGGTQDNGIQERDPLYGAGAWYTYIGGDGFDVMTDHPYTATDGESDDIYYTLNETIRGDNTDISVPGNTAFFGNLAMDPTNEDHIYVGYPQAVFHSFDAGESWTTKSSKAGNWAISTCWTNANRIYFAGRSCNNCSKEFTRMDGSSSFNLMPGLFAEGYMGNKITDIEVSRTNSENVYITVSGFDSLSKVFFTSDAGDSWQNISYNLPNVPIFCIERDASGGVYVGTFIGVFYKKSGENFWQPFYNGMPTVAVTQLERYLEGGIQKIMASTYGRGIWKTDVYSAVCPNDLTLTGNVEGKYYKDAVQTISSSQVVSGNLENKIKYNAGTSHSLLPGFHAKAGSEFRTYLLGCGEEIEHD